MPQNENEVLLGAIRDFRYRTPTANLAPFADSTPVDPLNVALKAFQGFITGFTTIPVGEEPGNTAEAIAQSIGHLMGFVGVVPGLGSVGSLTAKGISRGLNLVRAGHLLQEGTAIGSGLVKVAQFKSIPMLGADLIMKGFQKTAGVTGAARLVPEFMKTSPYWKIGGGILEGSQHLGFASAISNWTGGVDQMMDSYLHGAIAGGAFRAFGEIFPQPLAKGERLVGSDFWTKFKGNVQDPRGLARIFSSALFTGLPSTNADEPFELQVYNYLLGAYFGVNEMSQSQRNIARFLTREPYEALKGSGLEPDAAMVRMRLADYKSLPGWKKLSETEKQEVEHQIAMDGIRAVNLQINGELFNISEGGISLNKLQYKALEDYNKDLMEQFKSGNMSRQEYEEKISRPMKDLVGAQIVKRFIDKNEQRIKNNEELDPKDILDVMSEMGKEVTELAEMSKVLRTEEKKTRSYMKELENREIAPILDSIQAALIENKQLETNSNMLYPIKAIVDYSFTAKAQAGEAPPSKEKYFERVKEVVELVRRHSPESEEPSKSDKFQKFIESFQDKYELTSAFESQEQYSNFRRVWLREKYLKDIPMSAYNVDTGRLEPTKGKSQWKAFPFIETVLDAYLGRDANGNSQVGYENIKEIVTYKSGKREVVTETPTYKDIYEAKMGNDSQQDGLKQIQKKLYEQGKSILFGVKDDANLIVTNIIVPGASAKQKLNYSIEYLRRLQHIAKTEGMTKQFKQAMKNINGKEMETVAYVNNLMTLELLNGFKPGEGLATMFNKKNLGKFLMFPNKLNKRTSLLNNGFLPFEPSLLRIPGMEIKDSDGNTVKVGIFQAIDKDISLNSKVPDLTEPVMINGKVVEGHKTGTHVDGAIWVRSDLYDAMMRGGGLPWDSGAQKGTLVHSDPGKGMLLGKFAYHRASPEMSEAMMKAGLHMSLNTTSAKMFGLRDLYKWQYNPDSKSYNFYNSKNEQIYGEKPQEDLTKLKRIDLYKRAKELGLKGLSKAKKVDLIKILKETPDSTEKSLIKSEEEQSFESFKETAVKDLTTHLPSREQYIEDMVKATTETFNKENLWGKKYKWNPDLEFLTVRKGEEIYYIDNQKELAERVRRDIYRNVDQKKAKEYWKKKLQNLPDDVKQHINQWMYTRDINFYTSDYGKLFFDFNAELFPDIKVPEGQKKMTKWDATINSLLSGTGSGSHYDIFSPGYLISNLGEIKNNVVNWYKNLSEISIEKDVDRLSKNLAFKHMVVATHEKGFLQANAADPKNWKILNELAKKYKDKLLRKEESSKDRVKLLSGPKSKVLEEKVIAEKVPEAMKWEEIPMMSFTFTEGGEGSKPNNRSISTRKQMATVASDKIFGNVRNWLNQKSLEAFRGDLIENTRYDDWVSKGTVDPESIDVNKLSVKYKLEILYGGADSPLWRKLIKEYTKQWESDPEEFDSEVQRNNAYMEEQYSALQKLMTLWENDPPSMMSKPLRKRVEMFVGSAIRDEIVRPKVPAMETIMSPYSADIMSKFPDFKPGEIILHENNRQEKIQWGKERKEVTLEQALEEYNQATQSQDNIIQKKGFKISGRPGEIKRVITTDVGKIDIIETPDFIKITRSEIPLKENRGKKKGIELYEKLINSTDKLIKSDVVVSEEARNVWLALKRRGHDIKENPSKKRIPSKTKDSWTQADQYDDNITRYFSSSPEKSVFEVQGKGSKAKEYAKEDIKQMESDLTLVGVRVPLSAPNGVRALRIAGFSGIKGRGAIFHPEDMKNMDGADLDIDKAVLYKNLPQDAIGDVLRAKDLQHKYYIRSSGKVVSDALYDRLGASRVESLVKSGKLGSFFTSPKEDLRFRVDQKEPINTNPFAVGDPMVMSKINEYSYWGKRSLGGGINTASNIESLMGFPEGAIKGLERRPDAERSFRKAKTTFINEAADASDGVHLKKLWDMQWELIKSAYNLKEDFFPTKVTRNDKGEIVKQRPYYTKDEKTNRTIAHPEAEWIKREPTLKDITSQDIWIALSSLNKYAKNRDNLYRPITFHESTIASRKAIQENLSQYMDKANPFVKAMERVSEIDMNNLSLEFGEVPFLGGEFNNNSRLIEKLLRDNPTLASIMGRYNTRLHNNLRNSKSYKEWKAKSVFFASEQLKELYSQDIFDMTSIFMVNQFLPKDAGKQVTFFKDMHDEVWRWKKKYTRMINDRGFEGRFDILAEANREYAQLQFKYKEHKDLIDAFALSSLYPQFKDIEELRYDRKKSGIKFYNNKISGTIRELKKLKENFAQNSQAYSDLSEKLKNDRLARKLWIDGTSKEWKEANAELTKNHMESNLANWLYEVPNISNKVIARQNTVYRGIIGASKQKLTKEDLNELDKYIEQPEITPDIVYKDPTAFTERQREKYILATKAPSPEFEGLDPKVKADMEKALGYIDQYLKKYPQYIGQLDAIFSGVQEGKTWVAAQRTLVGPRIAQPADIIEVGNFLKKVLDNAGKPIPLQKKHWIFYTPQKIGEVLTTYDPVLISKQVPVIESFGPEKGAMREILSFNSTAGRVAEAHNNGQLNERAWHQKIENKWQEHPLEIVTKQLDKLHDGLGSKLWDIVLAKREMSVGKNRDGSERTSLYGEIWEKVEAEYNKLAEDKSVYSIPYLRGAKLTAKQLMDKMQKAATKWSEKSANTYIRNKEAEQDFFYDKYGRKRTGIWSFGYINVSRAVDELGKRLSKGDQTILGANLLNRIGHQIRMENIELNAANGAILYLNKAISRRDFGRILKGERKYADKPEGETYTPEEIRNLSEYKEWLKGNSEWNKTDNFEKTIINYYFKAIQNGKDFIKVRDVVQPKDRAILLDALKFSKLNETGWMEYKDIEFRPDWFEKYFPHLDHSREGIKIWIKDKLTRMRKENKALTDIVSEKEIAQRELIEGQSGYDKLSHNFQEMMEQRITEKSIVEPNINAKFSLGRNKDFPIPEWSRELGAMRKYEQQMATFYWRSVANLLSQKHIEGLRKSQALGKNTEQWIKFLQVYNRDQIGYPAVIPAEWSQDKEFESSLQPYWVFTNNFAKQVADKIGYTQFSGKKLYKELGDIVSEKEWEALTPQEQRALRNLVDAGIDKKLMGISSLEAKWNLISLLSHTKTLVNNMIGGKVNVFASTGLSDYRKANNLTYMKENIFTMMPPGKEVRGMEDVLRIMEEAGGLEMMFRIEADLAGTNKAYSLKSFFEEAIPTLKGGKFSAEGLRDLAKKHKISDRLLETSGWFMRWSEVKLRKQAWLAHYIKAKETLDALGMVLEYNHPWLFQMANKGVAGTQFLYNQANRPAFARTPLGKIFSRFQLWAWNSVKFRKDVLAEIERIGYKANSAEANRVQRLMTADLFMFALAGIFPASIFESNLAPPMSYLEDLAAFFFGDKKEKERAFYGVLPYPFAPLQAISPPSTRVLYNTLSLAVNGDLDTFGSRVMSWMPFGRFTQSIYRTIDSPKMFVENFAGIPIHRMTGWKKKVGESERLIYSPTTLFK